AAARPICPSRSRWASSSRRCAISSGLREGTSSMSARILVVDDVPANVKLLEARLSAEYFDVSTAYNGADALAMCERAECDIVLLDVMMPDMDGFEVCRRIKSGTATHHIPLEMVTDELRMRAQTSLEIGIESPERDAVTETGRNGRILLVDDRQSSYERIASMLATEHTVDIETEPGEALFHAAEGDYELVIVSLGLANFDGLRLCSQIRSLDRTRNVSILAIAEPDNNARLLRGLEIGVNDYLMR